MKSPIRLLAAALSIICGVAVSAEPTPIKPATRPADPPFVNLYPGPAPAAQGDGPGDTPAEQIYLPKKGTGTGSAIVVCPGGGNGGLAKHESGVVGQWLADNGIAAFVLRYRLGPKYHHPVELHDAQRAIRFVRAKAGEWKIDPKRIGILGFSAGGHLTTTAATHFDAGDANAADPIDRVSSRPDVQIPVYPVVTLSGPNAHRGSRNNLLGATPDDALVDLLSNQKQVTAQTPPAFVVHSTQDKAVPIGNSDDYVAALKAANVEAEYIRGEYGGHGFGLKDFWTKPCIEWLRKQKF